MTTDSISAYGAYPTMPTQYQASPVGSEADSASLFAPESPESSYVGDRFSTTFDQNVVNDIDKFYDATYCVGTNDEDFEAVLNNINADNVMDYMCCWNKLHSAEKGESFIEAFMWDADSGQKEKFGKVIIRALRDKAEKEGVYDKCLEDFGKIDKELRSWIYISNDISENYDNIVKAIGEALGGKYKTYATPKTQNAETK